jgi:membrane protein
MSAIWSLCYETFNEFLAVKAPRLGAALAFYTTLSLAPLLVIVLAIAGAIYGDDAARAQLTKQIDGVVGPEGAAAVRMMLENSTQPGGTWWGTILGIGTLVFTATAAFNELQSALNTIWHVQPRPDAGYFDLVRGRVVSFAMVVSVGFLLLVSLVISTLLSALGAYVGGFVPDYGGLLQIANLAVSFLVITLLFALMFKLLPDVEVPWKNVWIGAAVTGLLFVVGKFAIGFYLGVASVSSAYGAAGSFVVLLLWVYYSAQILLFGAEFTRVYTLRTNEPLPEPTELAEFADDHPEKMESEETSPTEGQGE